MFIHIGGGRRRFPRVDGPKVEMPLRGFRMAQKTPICNFRMAQKTFIRGFRRAQKTSIRC